MKVPMFGALLLSGAVAGCSSTATPPALPSVSASISGSATPSPEASVTPTASGPLAPNDMGQVVTTDLVMRSAPGGGPDSEVYPGALDAPTLLFIVDGPVTESGYDWYLAYPFTMSVSESPEHWRLAWVAAGSRDGEAWIAPVAPNCPRADFDHLTGLSPIGALLCYGDRPLTLEGSFGECGYIYPGVVTPSWLGSFVCLLRPLGTSPDAPLPGTTFSFNVRSDVPGGTQTLDYERGTSIRIVGHFDDPAAQTCLAGPLPGPEPTPGSPADEILADQWVVLSCRAHFVVTESAQLAP